MTGAERVPLTGAEMDHWSALPGGPGPSDPTAIGVRAVAAGIDPAWSTGHSPTQGLVGWNPPEDFPLPADHTLEARLRTAWHPDQPARAMEPPLRLVVRGPVLPREVIPRLLLAPGIGSAFVPVSRAPGALRRRPWAWPLRLGIADDELRRELDALRDSGIVPPALVDISDVRTEPGAVDVLLLRDDPESASRFVSARRQVANAVICGADTGAAWPIVDAQLALVRAASAAVLTAVTGRGSAAETARSLLLLVRHLSHAHPIDVALTSAFDRRILIAAEPEAIAAVSLPELLRERAERARGEIRVLSRMAAPSSPQPVPPPMPPGAVPPPAPPPMAERPDSGGAPAESAGVPEAPEMAGAEPPPEMGGFESPLESVLDVRVVEAAADEIAHLSEGSFDHESSEASRVLDVQATIESSLDAADAAVAAEAPRLLQAYIGAGVAATRDNVLRAGANAVDVFVGPLETQALHALAVPDAAIGFDDPALTSARLTVVLAPLVPEGPAVRAELDVPRFGRSPDARLEWMLPDRGLVQARLMILHRNRIIQTARITGRVGSVARVTDRIVLWDQLGRLDERQPFDRTFVVNHDARGRARMVSHADGATTIEAMDEIDASTERIRRHLIRATQLRSKGAKAVEDTRRILVDVAVEGHDLYDFLADHLERFVDARRIQIVTARSGRFLPLELVYHRPAPDPDAVMCANWTAGRECGDHCFVDADDTSVVCPSVFWGMSRFIERQLASLTDADGNAFRVSASPTRGRRTLSVSQALLGASRKVRTADVGKTAASLGQARTAATWAEWVSQLTRTPTDLLVLMPHTDPAVATLEISGVTLRRGNIEAKHVTGAHDVRPVMVLLGCDTAGSDEDPAGYATRFMAKGAAVVFSTLTMLLAGHAATMSQQLAAKLHDPGRKAASLGQFVTEFRRESMRAGFISALAVTAYGDSDWRL